jgi:dolichol kinase
MLDSPLIRVSSFFVLVLAFQIAVAKLSLGKENRRRFQHAITGHALVQISYFLPIDICIGALALGCLGILYVQLYQSTTYKQLFEPLLRPEELREGVLPGAFYFLLGTMITACFFPLDIARYAVECLSFADPLASFVGKSISSPKISANASIAGCFASFFTALFLGMVCFDLAWTEALAGSFACSTVEAFLSIMNDNFSIPVATAAAVCLFQNWK